MDPLLSCIQQYYQLKTKYELSIKQFNKPSMVRCIQCNKTGGTVFSNSYNTETMSKELRAYCGHVSNPCSLSIHLIVGDCLSLEDIIKDTTNELNNNKTQLIKVKNDAQFGLISNDVATEAFKKLKMQIEELTNVLQHYTKNLLFITDNDERATSLDNNIKELYAFIDTIKSKMIEFDDSGNNQYLLQIVEIYKEIDPIIKNISRLKYETNFVSTISTGGEYISRLIQHKYKKQSLETNIGENKIVTFSVEST